MEAGNIQGQDLVNLCESSDIIRSYCEKEVIINNEEHPDYLFERLITKAGIDLNIVSFDFPSHATRNLSVLQEIYERITVPKYYLIEGYSNDDIQLTHVADTEEELRLRLIRYLLIYYFYAIIIEDYMRWKANEKGRRTDNSAFFKSLFAPNSVHYNYLLRYYMPNGEDILISNTGDNRSQNGYYADYPNIDKYQLMRSADNEVSDLYNTVNDQDYKIIMDERTAEALKVFSDISVYNLAHICLAMSRYVKKRSDANKQDYYIIAVMKGVSIAD